MELHHAPVTFGLIVRDEAPRRALAFVRMPIDSSKAFAARQIDARADKFESEGRRSFDGLFGSLCRMHQGATKHCTKL
jgi:hypothetical protein